MNIVENLTVKVTYYVSLSEIEVPKQIHEQLIGSCENEKEIYLNDPYCSEAEVVDVSEIYDED